MRPLRNVRWKSVLDVATSIALLWAAGTLVFGRGGRQAAAVDGLVGRTVSIDGAPTKGSPNAKIVIVAFADFLCPACRTFVREVLPAVERDYIEPGRILLVFRQNPLDIHPLARAAADRAECVARQGRFWAFHDRLFNETSELTAAGLDDLTVSFGVARDSLSGCVAAGAERVQQDLAVAKALAIRGTPYFLLGSRPSPNSIKVQFVVSGAIPLSAFRKALDQVKQN